MSGRALRFAPRRAAGRTPGAAGSIPAMRRLAIALVCLCALTACSSTATTSLGDTVYVDSGPDKTPVGVTRDAFSRIAKALAADDTEGAALVIAGGEGRFVNRCTSGKLIDTAIGGERQIRLPNGDAVWLDANWIKKSCT